MEDVAAAYAAATLITMQNLMAIGTWAEHYNADNGGKLMLYQWQDGQFRMAQEIDTGKSISILAEDQENHLLFAVCETNYHRQDEAGGEIQVYQIGKTGTLTLLERSNSYGGFPVGLIILKKYIVVLNHGSNLSRVCRTRKNEDGKIITEFASDEASLCLFERKKRGRIGNLLDCYIFHGSGKLPVFQESPAPHDLYYAEESGQFYVPMRGTDTTKVFCINEQEKRLVLVQSLQQREGTGPRNVWYRASEISRGHGFLYVVSEIEPVITVFEELNGGWERREEVAIVDVLPQDIPSTSFEYPHPSGIIGDTGRKKLYTITRKPDVLSVFEIQENGTLRKETEYLLNGKNPRQMILEKDRIRIICMDTKNILEIQLDQNGRPVQSKEIVCGVERIACMALLQEVGEDD